MFSIFKIRKIFIFCHTFLWWHTLYTIYVHTHAYIQTHVYVYTARGVCTGCSQQWLMYYSHTANACQSACMEWELQPRRDYPLLFESRLLNFRCFSCLGIGHWVLFVYSSIIKLGCLSSKSLFELFSWCCLWRSSELELIWPCLCEGYLPQCSNLYIVPSE